MSRIFSNTKTDAGITEAIGSYFEKHYLIKKFGVGIMGYTARDVEAMSIIEDIDDAYQSFQYRKQQHEIDKTRRR
jgi:hypothetical protein